MSDGDKKLSKIEKDLDNLEKIDKENLEKSKSFSGNVTIKEYPAGKFLSWPHSIDIIGHENKIEVPLRAIENIYVKNPGEAPDIHYGPFCTLLLN